MLCLYANFLLWYKVAQRSQARESVNLGACSEPALHSKKKGELIGKKVYNCSLMLWVEASRGASRQSDCSWKLLVLNGSREEQNCLFGSIHSFQHISLMYKILLVWDVTFTYYLYFNTSKRVVDAKYSKSDTLQKSGVLLERQPQKKIFQSCFSFIASF